MAQDDLETAKDPDLVGSMAALKRAAALARQIAIQTNTAIVIYEEGKIVRYTAAQLLAEQLNPTDPDTPNPPNSL